MVRFLIKNKAQIVGEYALTILLVVMVLTAMTVYVRRVIQARVFDARRYMIEQVKTAPNLIGTIYLEYEPYYVNSTTDRDMYQDEQKNLVGGGRTGIFRKYFNEGTASATTSVQLPPSNAD